MQIGEWRVDPALDEIRRGDTVIKLEPRMMRLLCCLASRPGEVFAASELLDAVWPGVVVNPSSVYQVVALLRRSLGDEGDEPRYISTVPRKGYRLIASVSSDASVAAEGPDCRTSAAEDAAPSVSAHDPRARLVLGAIAIGVVATIATALGAWLHATREPQVVRSTPALVVLPLTDLSADGGNAAFCDGLTEELLNALGRVPGLRVTGRTSAFRARDERIETRRIGELLGVTHVLEGSVRATSDRLRISAQLVSTRDGFQVWSNSFDRPRSQLLSIQTEIARAVVAALELQLAPAQADRLTRPASTAVNAYDLYLLGRHQQYQRTPESIGRAVGYQEQAIAADPKFALAYAGLADAHMAGYYYANRPFDESTALAQRAVDQALRLDPQLAEAYVAWGVILIEQWRHEEARDAFRRAIAINSNYALAYAGLANAYEYDGQPLAALPIYDQALALDPLYMQLHVRRCTALMSIGRYAEADRACARAFELQPDAPNALWMHGVAAYDQGDLPTAIHRYTQALARAPRRVDVRAELGLLYLDVGLPERAAAEFDKARADGAGAQLSATLARQHVAAGDHEALARSVRATDWTTVFTRTRIEAAYLATMAGDSQQASLLLQGALTELVNAEDWAGPAYYPVQWGVCEACSLGYLLRQSQDVERADHHERRALSWLAKAEAAGYRFHGLQYARATVQAQRGETPAALDSLERAVQMGWRRAWLMRVDPALAPLRKEARFTALLERIDALNSKARRQVLAGENHDARVAEQ